MDWVWDTFETYRLNQADLQAYLAELYGSYDFAIEVRLMVTFHRHGLKQCVGRQRILQIPNPGVVDWCT